MRTRIRTVKPELFKHRELFLLEKESGLPMRLAFINLFGIADREGRFEWRDDLVFDLLPWDTREGGLDLDQVVGLLTESGYLVKYEANGRTFYHIPTFHKHQHINNRESASVIPEPSQEQKEQKGTEGKSRQGRVTDASPTRGTTRSKRVQNKCGTDDKALVEQVVACLNRITGRNFKASTLLTCELVLARIREGYTLHDIELVIQDRYRRWGADPKRSQFLRPQTLLEQSYFEGYLQDAKNGNKRSEDLYPDRHLELVTEKGRE